MSIWSDLVMDFVGAWSRSALLVLSIYIVGISFVGAEQDPDDAG